MKQIIRLGAVIIITVCLFPPWVRTTHFGQVRSEIPMGYAPIFRPPVLASSGPAFGVVMDTNRLLCEVGAILALLALAWTFTRRRTT